MTWRYRGQKESQAHHKASCKDRLLRPYLMLQVPSQHVSKSNIPIMIVNGWLEAARDRLYSFLT